MRVIAFAGNPNVGKSTIFNALTGMNQHTGNWPGKTVELAQGKCRFKGETYQLVDLPGTYSLISRSAEESVTEEFLRNGQVDCAVAICDATCLERSLILALQMKALCKKMVVCINLIDEAQRQNLQIDAHLLQAKLGVPVALTSARDGEGLQQLLEAVRSVCEGFAPMERISNTEEQEQTDEIARAYVLRAQALAQACTHQTETKKKRSLTQSIDAVLLHPFWGYAAMLLLLFAVLWLTIEGANYPSHVLQDCFDRLQMRLTRIAEQMELPRFLTAMLLDGIYATVGRVISVMLPPMAIFFPLFTLLEDFGYLPRAAFLLDERFRKAGACGKQALTMCMGFGCNAVGVAGCRIIDSPREQKLAILTNSFVPCNGRFSALVFLIGIGFSYRASLLGALLLTLCILLSVVMTLLATKLLHKTCLSGLPSSFVMELPPYRKPRVMQVIVRSIFDRTLRILARAIVVAAPAGLILWLLANVHVNGHALVHISAGYLEHPSKWLGLNGTILLAFILGFPANELVMPIIVMILTAETSFSEVGMEQILLANGWTWQLSLCTIVFFLFHWPCATTLWTIYKETGSKKQTIIAAVLPTAFGALLCVILNLLF